MRQRAIAYLTLLIYSISLTPVSLYANPPQTAVPGLLVSTEDSQEYLDQVSEVYTIDVSPEAGGQGDFGEVALSVPPGAVNDDMTITVEKLLNVQPMNDGMANVTGTVAGYRFLPAGTKFNTEIQITLPYNPSGIKNEADKSNLFSYFYNTETRAWEMLERISLNEEAHTVTSVTTHFTDIINATLTLPESPSPIDHNINSIKDLEAANPLSGIPQIDGLKPGPTGAASFSLPLNIPRGRGGATPQLSLSYSSESPNSWLGKGFNISVESVSTDTRFGIPSYEQSDRYLLNGEQLLFDGIYGSDRLYVPRIERAFDDILWVNAVNGGYWQVTSKTGMVKRYGQGNGWIGPDYDNKSAGVYTWFLTSITDPYGNTVEYQYDQDRTNHYTYLNTIIYSGGAGPSHYSVEFVREGAVRQDRRVDARGTFPSKLAYRLEEVIVRYDNRTIRSYRFDYEYNEFGQSQMTTFSEYNGDGVQFYNYDFAYYGIEKNAEGNAIPFGSSYETWTVPGATNASFSTDENKVRGLGQQTNWTLGASFGLGVTTDIFAGVWLNILSVSGTAGASTNLGYSNSSVMDINGDGIPDMVWRANKSTLRAYLGTGSGFSDNYRDFHFDASMGSLLNQSNQLGFSLGLSVGSAGLSYSRTQQNSFTSLKSTFTDINGDGFVDFVNSNSDNWFQFDGHSFSEVSYAAAPGSPSSGAAMTDDRYDRAYYLQEPIRKWKALFGGQISIDEQVSLLGNSRDGVSADTYYANEAIRLPLNAARTEASFSEPLEVGVSAEDNVYFHLDSNNDPNGDDVTWDVSISYDSIKLLEDLRLAPELIEPDGQLSLLPDQRLAPLYEFIQGNPDEGIADQYLLYSDWRQRMGSDQIDYFAENMQFIPKIIPEAIFAKVLNAANAASIDGAPSERAILLDHTRYLPERKLFVRSDSAVDPIIAKYAITDLLLAERIQLLTSVFPDGTVVFPESDAQGDRFLLRAEPTNPEAVIFAATDWNETLPLGSAIYPGGYLLDVLVSDDDHREYVWAEMTDGIWDVYSTTVDGEKTFWPVDASEDDGLTLTVNRNGVDMVYQLGDFTRDISRVPDALYSGRMSDRVMSDEHFNLHSLLELNSSEWTYLTDNLASSEMTLLAGLYVKEFPDDPQSGYVLPDTLSEADRYSALSIINAAIDFRLTYKGNPSLVHVQEFGGGSNIILLQAGEYLGLSSFASERGENIADLFSSVSTDGAKYYYIPSGLSSGQIFTLQQIVFEYRRDVELFPWFVHQDDGYWTVIENADGTFPSEVMTLYEALGIGAYQRAQREYSYLYDLDSPVTYDATTEGLVPDALWPQDSEGYRGENPGYVELPVLGLDGTSHLTRTLIPRFNSGTDYSAEEGFRYPDSIFNVENMAGLEKTAEDLQNVDTEIFAGGINGWYYGSWTGYYDFNASELHSGAPDTAAGEVLKPQYFVPMNSNVDNEGQIIIAATGRDYQPMTQDFRIASVSSYQDTLINDNGDSSIVEFSFASYINGDDLSPNRNGGDSYDRIPRSGVVRPGGGLGEISLSRSKTIDQSGGVSIPLGAGGVGVSISSNEGSSWQYGSLMDMNGDRYPDIINFSEDFKDSSAYTIQYGSPTGFGPMVDATSAFPGLGDSTNIAYGFGLSPSGVGSMVLQFNTKGVLKAEEAMGTNNTSTPQLSATPSANGTIGMSVQNSEMQDINGDGLPDQLYRLASGAIKVALNLGDGSFAPAVDWSEAFNLNLPGSALFGEANDSGLSYTNSGSIGGNLNISIPVDAGVVSVTTSVSAGVGASGNQTLYRLMDINSDGLADIVSKLPDEPVLNVRLNYGDRFATEQEALQFSLPEWDDSFLDYADILNEITSANSENPLSDLIVPININTSGVTSTLSGSTNHFADVLNPFRLTDTLDYTSGININLGGSLSTGTYIPVWFIRFGFNVTAGVNGAYAVSTTSLRMQDINGDGLPDHVLRRAGSDKMYVRVNHMDKVGMLKNIALPQGGRYEIEYTRVGNTVDMPQSRLVMSRVTMDDMSADIAPDRGVHTYSSDFEYSDGKYDRINREFLGFATVKSIDAFGTQSVSLYDTDSFYTKMMSRGSYVVDDAGIIYSATSVSISSAANIYDPGFTGPAFVFVEAEESFQYPEGVRWYEGDSYPDGIHTKTSYEYGNYGNVRSLTDFGNVDVSGDEVYARIDYWLDNPVFRAHPVSIEVYEGTGADRSHLLRWRKGAYNSDGSLERLTQYTTNSLSYSWDLDYDQYGNISTVSDPNGYTMRYTYDEHTKSYVEKIETYNNGSSAGHYTSSMTWDYMYGVPLTQSDLNGNTITNEYDQFGRITKVFSPYDKTIPAVEYEYHNDLFPMYAYTRNKVTFDPHDSETLDTVLTVDGLGRVIQTAKEGVIYDEGTKIPGWNISGAVSYDEKGRTVQQGLTSFQAGTTLPRIATIINPTISEYDALDRPITVTLPDSTPQIPVQMFTTFATVNNNQEITQVDPEGNITRTQQNVRGQIESIEKYGHDNNGSEILLTSASYRFSPLGELQSAFDHDGNETSYTYDLMGQMLSFTNPNTGTTSFTYDGSGNMRTKTTEVLRDKGETINYLYDDFNRLETIDYPFSDDVTMVYGDANASDNGAGRLISRTDESGTVEYGYGLLGEQTYKREVLRRFQLPEEDPYFPGNQGRGHAYAYGRDSNNGNGPEHLNPWGEDRTAEFSYQYDYLGRMQSITYPRGEVVTYSYDQGGQVTAVTGEKNGLTTDYVQDIGYDEYGQRVYIRYGNGVETNYSYDEKRRWLDSIETTNHTYGSQILQNMDYSFDKVGNVLSVSNDSGPYATTQSYSYDGLYQLTGATGSYTSRPDGYTEYTGSYSQDFSYDALGNMMSKVSQSQATTGRKLGMDLNYSLDYSYYQDAPNQVERIGDTYYQYDANGNLRAESEGGHIYIDENEDIHRLSDTADGVAYGVGLDSNNGNGNNGVRIFSWDEENRLMQVSEKNDRTAFIYNADGQRTHKYSTNGETLYFDSMFSETQGAPNMRLSYNIYLGETRIATKLGIDNYNNDSYERYNTFYYHGDHLGSAQLVTDYEGQEYEHIEYTPYGEMWIDKSRDNQEQIPFKFTGKEWDEETQLYYYGARYLDPRTSRWVSADPARAMLANPMGNDGKPRQNFAIIESLNHYSYVSNNPVKYVDPIGHLQKDPDGYVIFNSIQDDTLAEAYAHAGYSSVKDAATALGLSDLYADDGEYLGGSIPEGLFLVDAGALRPSESRRAENLATNYPNILLAEFDFNLTKGQMPQNHTFIKGLLSTVLSEGGNELMGQGIEKIFGDMAGKVFGIGSMLISPTPLGDDSQMGKYFRENIFENNFLILGLHMTEADSTFSTSYGYRQSIYGFVNIGLNNPIGP